MAVTKLDDKEKKFLLSLARKSIQYYLSRGQLIQVSPSDVPSKNLVENGACFVTLYMSKELRGCIGTLEAHRPLFMDVLENAVASAVGDPRFFPLSMQELHKVKISISVLTEPKDFPVNGPDDILKKLVPHKHGLILKQGLASATFLPVVWEQLPDKVQFLQHLSMKARLEPDGWRDPKTKFQVYEAIEFSE